jgi:ABC-type transporter Mla subunit MlaD
MEINGKRLLQIGAAISFAGLFTFLGFEMHIIGSIFKFEKFVVDQHQENIVAGPNTDLAKALDTLRMTVDDTARRYQTLNLALEKSKKDLEDLESQKDASAKKLAQMKQEEEEWRRAIEKEIADLRAIRSTLLNEREQIELDITKRRRELATRNPASTQKADKTEGNPQPNQEKPRFMTKTWSDYPWYVNAITVFILIILVLLIINVIQAILARIRYG